MWRAVTDLFFVYRTSPYSGALKENVVGMLNELCILNNMPMPEYIPLKEEGPPHARMFTFQCRLSSIVETGKFCFCYDCIML